MKCLLKVLLDSPEIVVPICGDRAFKWLVTCTSVSPSLTGSVARRSNRADVKPLRGGRPKRMALGVASQALELAGPTK